MQRRLLLQGLFLSLWSEAAGVTRRFTGRFRLTREQLGRPADEPASPPSALSAAELQSLLAFGEVVVAGRPLSLAERRDFSEHIEDWTRSIPAQIASYRTTVKLLDRLAGRPFSSLEVSDRIQLLRRHHFDRRVVPLGEAP